MSIRTVGAICAWLLLAHVAHVQAADSGVDTSVAPGDDFFAYANGEWLAKARIPDSKARWGARDEINAATAQQLAQVIRGAGALPHGRKVADFHVAYLDEAAIEKRGFAPIAPLLKSIEAIRDNTGLSRWLGAELRADVDPVGVGTYDSRHLFGLAVACGFHGEPSYIAYLTQGGLGLGDRDAYLDEAAPKQAERLRYRDYIARVLQGAGFDDATARADAVLALEIAIARTHASAEDSSKDSNADNRWARGDFQLNAPGIDWPAFFAAAGLAKRADFVVWQPQAIKASAWLAGSQPLPVWKDYLRFHVLHRYADVLPREFRSGTASRAESAVEATNRAMPEAVGRIYVARYFPPASKARLQKVLDNVVAAFRKRVVAAPWLSEESRRIALQKLDTMYFGIGYPEKWQDDSRLAIDPHDAFGNQRRVEGWSYKIALAKLGHAVDRREWVIAPQSPGANLNFQLNSYNFAAALLQPPKFDAAASDAATYGAIGAIFGHEVSHFVDTLGADYDASGASRNWWSAEDRQKYEAATRPLVEQFAAYRPFPDVAIDGKKTLVENVADMAGLAAAFDAYRAAPGPRQDREFFVGFAQSWRVIRREDAVRAMLKGDGHAPESYRIATVRNFDAWYEAFDVKPGQRLYLAPEERVRVW